MATRTRRLSSAMVAIAGVAAMASLQARTVPVGASLSPLPAPAFMIASGPHEVLIIRNAEEPKAPMSI